MLAHEYHESTRKHKSFRAIPINVDRQDLIGPMVPWAGSPWENSYCESFNGKLRTELLDGAIYYTLRESQFIIEQWRWHYKQIRSHSAPGYRPPAPETTVVHLTTVKTIGETQIVS